MGTGAKSSVDVGAVSVAIVDVVSVASSSGGKEKVDVGVDVEDAPHDVLEVDAQQQSPVVIVVIFTFAMFWISIDDDASPVVTVLLLPIVTLPPVFVFDETLLMMVDESLFVI